MRSKGSRFTLGPGGWGCADVAQPSAAVRNRPREVAMAVPMASSAKTVTFGSFNGHVASFRVAGVAICDTPTRFIICRKSFCVVEYGGETFASKVLPDPDNRMRNSLLHSLFWNVLNCLS